MQINIHNFTLTTGATATITITATDDSFRKYPVQTFRTMAAIEAEDLTGKEWTPTAVVSTDPLNVTVYLNKA